MEDNLEQITIETNKLIHDLENHELYSTHKNKIDNWLLDIHMAHHGYKTGNDYDMYKETIGSIMDKFTSLKCKEY